MSTKGSAGSKKGETVLPPRPKEERTAPPQYVEEPVPPAAPIQVELQDVDSLIVDSQETSTSASAYDTDDQFAPWHKRLHNRLNHISAANLPFNPVEPGIWDEWGVYYCSSRFGRHSRFKPYQFALIAIVVIGQNNVFDLINLMHENGGMAFYVVILIVYVAFGYPMFMLETLMGQYNGHKPILTTRLLMPALSGLGVAMYIRTFFRTIHSIGHFSISLYHLWDALFCKGSQSIYLRIVAAYQSQHKQFEFFKGLTYPYFSESQEDLALDKWMLLLCSLVFIICFKYMLAIGRGIKIILRILCVVLLAVTVSVYLRTTPKLLDGQRVSLSKDSLVYLPLYLTFTPDWGKVFDGMVWVRAIRFVMQALELGTVSHMYLGSKQFFHYRSHRDGVFLILLVITWNLVGVFGTLLWFGYIGITKDEIKNALHDSQGHHGLFLVYVMKFTQTEMTQQVEADVLFFAALFYLIVGVTGLLATVVHLYVLIDCSYCESGHPMFKLSIFLSYIVVFCFILLPLLVAEDGIRHMIVLDAYGGSGWVGLFLCLCLSTAIVWSYGVGRLMYDFFNIIHLKGYEVRSYSYRAPKVLAFIFLGFIFFGMIAVAIDEHEISEGPTDWTDEGTALAGAVMTVTPVIAVVVGIVHFFITKKKNTPVCEPHRDFFKNKHHICVCFKDYQYFAPTRRYRKAKTS